MQNDVTDKVEFGDNDGEFLPLTKCACGAKFNLWDFTLSIYKDDPRECDHCGRKLYFKVSVSVFEVKDAT